ncbi:hypothetical protein SAMN03159343_1189 [Klenkia marina]|uniref:Uncharacterized protein n=1 Tax=Klenkia marina TaxID=1960309 RepID=A0A1G4XQH4_9ACTN|nr:hypothetical protein [Klenkia marina]SCX43200.1 hypothetical protein SAMN03159343_1189 [Klenkia marina]
MTVPAVTRMGSWVLDRRGQGRGVRITRHPELHAINLSIWRDSVCAGTVHLTPADAAEVVQAITVQLAELARPAPPVRSTDRVDELEARIAELEQQALPRRGVWRRVLDTLVDVSAAQPFGRSTPTPPGPTGPLSVVC